MNERLYRSRDDRMLAGVAGGLAEIWDADPSLVRIVWALLVVLTGGLALLVYIIMAIVVPAGDAASPVAAPGPAAPGPAAPGPVSAAPGPTPEAASGPDAAAVSSAAAVAGAAGATATSDQFVPSAQPAPVHPREARRAARAARRAARGDRGSSAGLVIGALLILIGGAFLVREWLPAVDFDLFWPLALVALGVVMLVIGFTRDSGRGGTST